MSADARFVIVGGGQAAANAARAMRKLGYAGGITMIGAEIHVPYERPPLSKAVLHEGEEPHLAVLPAAEFAEADIDFVPGVRATALDVRARSLQLDDGRTMSYARCLLATGGAPRNLPQLPPGTPRTHYLRTLDHARRLRGTLESGMRLVIIGGGFLGLEVAHSAARRGVRVTVIESAPTLLTRFVVPALSAWLEQRLRDLGVELLLSRSVKDAAADAHGVRIALDDARVIEADEVLVAIGLVPETSLALDAGLAIDAVNGGIVVQHDGRTSDPSVFAAGDCASQMRASLGQTLRIESWQNANEQAAAAAAGMLDLAPPTPAYPWFWTDQGDHNLQMLGLAAPDLRYVRRGPADGAKVLWIGHRNGIPVHGIALNNGGDLRALRPLFEQRIAMDCAAFVSEATALRPWIKSLLTTSAVSP